MRGFFAALRMTNKKGRCRCGTVLKEAILGQVGWAGEVQRLPEARYWLQRSCVSSMGAPPLGAFL
jgi:hypothetical protein